MLRLNTNLCRARQKVQPMNFNVAKANAYKRMRTFLPSSMNLKIDLWLHKKGHPGFGIPLQHIERRPKVDYKTSILYHHFTKLYAARNKCVGEEFDYHKEYYQEEWELKEGKILNELENDISRNYYNPHKISNKSIELFEYNLQKKGVHGSHEVHTNGDDILPEYWQSVDEAFAMTNPGFNAFVTSKGWTYAPNKNIVLRKHITKCLLLRDQFFAHNKLLEESFNKDFDINMIEAGELQDKEDKKAAKKIKRGFIPFSKKKENNTAIVSVIEQQIQTKMDDPDFEFSEKTLILLKESDQKYEMLKQQVDAWEFLIEKESKKSDEDFLQEEGAIEIKKSKQDREENLEELEEQLSEFWDSIMDGTSKNSLSNKEYKNLKKEEDKNRKKKGTYVRILNPARIFIYSSTLIGLGLITFNNFEKMKKFYDGPQKSSEN